MRIHTIAKASGSMAQIAQGTMTPIARVPVKTTGTDAKISAVSLVAEVMAAMQGQANTWHGFAWRIIDGATDFRAEFVKLLDDRLKALKDENAKAHDWDKRTTNRAVASYLVNASRMRTIAKAFNAGGTVEGLGEFHGVDDPQNLGYMAVYEYARTFNASEARGRKADSFKVALAKFLKQRAESLATDTDKVNHARAVAFLETLQD